MFGWVNEKVPSTTCLYSLILRQFETCWYFSGSRWSVLREKHTIDHQMECPGLIFQTTLPNVFDALLLCACTLKNSNHPDLNNREKSDARIIFIMAYCPVAQFILRIQTQQRAFKSHAAAFIVYKYVYMCGEKIFMRRSSSRCRFIVVKPLLIYNNGVLSTAAVAHGAWLERRAC